MSHLQMLAVCLVLTLNMHAQMIRQHLGECYKVAISEEEVVYLTVHIKRVTMHVD